MSDYLVAALTPRLLNIHGDAQNAQVLAARAQWAGHNSRVIEVHTLEDAAAIRPQAITIGSGFDADATEVLAALEPMAETLHAWVSAGTPLLAIGLGWELLSRSTEFNDGTVISGLGIFSGMFIASDRAVGPISLQSDWGRLVGYEYHYRDYVLGEDEKPLGVVESGVGNRSGQLGQRYEGAVRAAAYGTTMRGPILARNPHLADKLLATYAAGDSDSGHRKTADGYAELANKRVIASLNL